MREPDAARRFHAKLDRLASGRFKQAMYTLLLCCPADMGVKARAGLGTPFWWPPSTASDACIGQPEGRASA